MKKKQTGEEIIKKFTDSIKNIYDTESGKEFFKYLKLFYVEQTCWDTQKEKVFYRLGQKELIQELLRLTEVNND